MDAEVMESPEELLPEEAATAEARRVPLNELPINESLISPEPKKALLASMEKHGLMQRVVLRAPVTESLNQSDMSQHAQYGEDADYFHTVIEGRRRIKAARMLGWTEIDAIVLTFPESDYSSEISAQLHGTRDENPATEAMAIKAMIAEGKSQPEICKLTGMAPQTVKRRLALIGLYLPLWEGFIEGLIALTVAESIAKLPQSVQEALAAVLEKKGTLVAADVKEARQARRDEAVAELPTEMFSGTDFGDEEDSEVSLYGTLALKQPDVVLIYEVLDYVNSKGSKGSPKHIRDKIEHLLPLIVPVATDGARF